jgi:hypothetical protein
VSQAFALSKPDHRILALAEELRERKKDRQVILVSKDVNLRIKAKSLGLLAEDYTTGKVRHVDRLYSGTASQIDTPYLDSQSNGLTVLIDRMKEAGAVRPREPGEGRAQPPRGAGEHAALRAVRPRPEPPCRRLQSIRMSARARNGGPSVCSSAARLAPQEGR